MVAWHMAIGLIQTVAPSAEPVVLSDLKAYLRVLDTGSDSVLTELIPAARRYLEDRTGRQFVTATWQMAADDWSELWSDWGSWTSLNTILDRMLDRFRRAPQALGLGLGGYYGLEMALSIELPRGPLQSVVSIKYTDENGVQQTLATNLFQVDNFSQMNGRIAPAYGQIWPTVRPGFGAVQITFVAGYGDATKVPDPIKRAIMAVAGLYYAQRASSEQQVGGTLIAIPAGLEAVVQQYRVKMVH